MPKHLHQCKKCHVSAGVSLIHIVLQQTPLSGPSTAIHSIFQKGCLGSGLFSGHVVPGCVYFIYLFPPLPTFGIFEPWHHVFAESCWLFLAQGHGGKSHKKRNYIIAYLEATRFHGSHPSNVLRRFLEPIKRWFCKHCIVSGRFRWANHVRSRGAHLFVGGHRRQVKLKDRTRDPHPVVGTAASVCRKSFYMHVDV